MESIILAGGLGTRLQGVIGASPKCMAPVAGKPFLHYLFHYLEKEGCRHVVLSLGYKSQVVTDWLCAQKRSFEITAVTEPEPLGTGGAVKLALNNIQGETVFILNGDTFFPVCLKEMQAFHEKQGTPVTLALKQMEHFDRYGAVHTNPQGMITGFEEKKYRKAGWINGGLYLINKNILTDTVFPERFSLEKDFLEPAAAAGRLSGFTSDAFFIDIGIPEDYERAQEEFRYFCGS